MFYRRMVAVFSAVLAGFFLAVTPGCQWLQGSDPSQRSSPVLSNLSIRPAAVLCAQEFLVSFDFEDPQGDIAKVRVTFEPSGVPEPKPVPREETPLWPELISKENGRVSFPFSFTPKPCTDQGGTWSITVEVEDEQGHISNKLTGQIGLTTVG